MIHLLRISYIPPVMYRQQKSGMQLNAPAFFVPVVGQQLFYNA